jgi:hypothetical protein
MNPQEKMKNTLEKSGIPFKEVKVYGRQIMVTTKGEESAKKWAALISNFAKVRPPVKSLDYNAKNKNTSLLRSMHTVFLVWGTI